MHGLNNWYPWWTYKNYFFNNFICLNTKFLSFFCCLLHCFLYERRGQVEQNQHKQCGCSTWAPSVHEMKCQRSIIWGPWWLQCLCQSSLNVFWTCSPISGWFHLPPVARFSLFALYKILVSDGMLTAEYFQKVVFHFVTIKSWKYLVLFASPRISETVICLWELGTIYLWTFGTKTQH